MGLNAFFVYTVCVGFGFTYANALVFVLVDGLIFILLTITGLRTEDIVGIHTYSRDEQLEVIDARYLTRLPKLTLPENKEPNKE